MATETKETGNLLGNITLAFISNSAMAVLFQIQYSYKKKPYHSMPYILNY
jgi:hypothetical protein